MMKNDKFYEIDSVCTHETLSPDPHFRLIPLHRCFPSPMQER